MKHDLDEVRKFLTLLKGDANRVLSFQTFFDAKKNIPELINVHKEFHCTLDQAIPWINHAQSNGGGVYATVNETDGTGRFEGNIIGYSQVFADWDNMPRPEYKAEPTFSTSRDSLHGHDFWRINEPIDKDTWLLLQKRISMSCKTDHQVVDVARVIRIAGFLHLKDPKNPAMYKITSTSMKEYSIQEIIDNFPLNKIEEQALENWAKNRDGKATGDGFTNLPRYIEQFKRWCGTYTPATEGGGNGTSSGTETLYRCACYAIDYGIDYEHSHKIMWDIYNPRCEPPWCENERENKRDNNSFNTIILRAYKNKKSEAGCKTTVGVFSSRPPILSRVDGWLSKDEKIEKANKEIVIEPAVEYARNGHRVSEKDGIKLLAQYDAKTPDYDLAVALDGILFNGENMIRFEDTCYLYNKGIWKEVKPYLIKSMIQNKIAHYSPPDSKVKSILNSVYDLQAVPPVRNNSWLVENDLDPKYLNIYDNGMLDTSCNPPRLLDHSNKFFTFNKREFNYNPNATCPNFEKFLMSSTQCQDAVKLVFQFIGYCLTPDMHHQKALFLLGKSRSGKGVLTNLIQLVIGKDSCASPPLNTLHTDVVLDTLSTKTVTFCNDIRTPRDPDLAMSIMLQLIGNDPITYNRKWKSAATSYIDSKFIMTANVFPSFIDATGALVKRLMPVVFPKSFSGRENTNLFNELKCEIAGISNRAMREYREMEVSKKGFIEPKESTIALDQIKDDMFKLSAFIKDMCEINQGYQEESSVIYKYYKIHSNIQGVSRHMTKPKMNKELNSSDLPIKLIQKREKGFRKNYFQGLRILPSVIQELDNLQHQSFKNVSSNKK